MRLKDKIALVTAATRGIGACIAREFAREGAIVYIGARRMDAAEKMADELNAKGLYTPYTMTPKNTKPIKA